MNDNIKAAWDRMVTVGNLVVRVAGNKKVLGLFRLAGTLLAVSKAVDAISKD